MQENVISTLNVSELLPGMYFIRIEYSGKITEDKLIIN